MDSLWTMELAGKAVGRVGLTRMAPDAMAIEEWRIDPAWQHTSITKRLLAQVREHCLSQGCGKLRVEAGVMPGWLLMQMDRHGFHAATPAEAGGSVLEFGLALEPLAGPSEERHVLRVLLADDHRILRRGMCELLGECPEIVVVGEAGDGQEAVRMAMETQPDVVLMDVTMPRMDGIEATRLITSGLPRVRVIGLSMHEGSEVATAMREAGARGYLCKSMPSEAIVAAVLGA